MPHSLWEPAWPADDWLDQPPDLALHQIDLHLADALARGDRPAQLQAWMAQGQLRDALGHDGAADALQLAVSSARAWGDEPRWIEALLAQIHCDADHTHHARALSACRLALDAARALGLGGLAHQALHASATSLCYLGEHDLAVEGFEEARLVLLAQGADPASPPARVALARCAAGQAQAWLMRGGLLLEAGSGQAAGEALQRARTLGERACDALAGAGARHSHPALFGLVRVLLELGEGAQARAWVARVRADCPTPAPPGTLAFALWVLTESMIDLRVGGAAPARVLERLREIQEVGHPRLRGGDLRLAVLRCLFEAYEGAGDYRRALECQALWSQIKARVRRQLAHEHGRWAEETLTALRNEADEFVTQDLRGPLAQAWGALRALPADTDAAQPVEALRRAAHSVRRAMDIADQYLSVIRAEHLRREDLGPLDLSALVDDVCEQMAPPAGSAVRLERRIEPGVPILGDRILLMRALANLMSNAFKHAPDGSCVDVTLERARGTVQLRVRDQGPGMPLDMRVRLFQRFATGAVRKGNGLGLAMVARVARVHDARIAVESETGHGTTVTIALHERAKGAAQ